MKVAAAVLSWIGGIVSIGAMWGSISPLIVDDTVWLLLPLFYTLITIGVLIYRQWATNHGHKVLPGILTIIFCGLLGGIFTLCIPEEDLGGYVYKPRPNSYLNNYSSSSYQRQSTQTKSIFPQPVLVGDRIEVIESFYSPIIGRRVNSKTISKAEKISGTKVSFPVSDGTCSFMAETDMSNLRIIGRTVKPVEEPKNTVPQQTKQLDKFEEIKKYKELLDLDIITQEEFDAKKKELKI